MASLWQKLRSKAPLKRFYEGERLLTAPVELHRKRVYILPTEAGVAFGFLLLAMLLGAMNYQNSLAYILSFLLISLALVSMVETYRQLLGLTLHVGHIEPVFATQPVSVPLIINKPGKLMHFAIKIRCGPQTLITDLLDKQTTAHLLLNTQERGQHTLGFIKISCRHPFGLFYAWSPLPLDNRYLVFPKMEEHPPPLPWSKDLFNQQGARAYQGDDYAGLKPYYPGDPIKHIHWKAHAKGQGLQSKHFTSDTQQQCWIDWNETTGLGMEQRLARLCRWLVDAERDGHRYGLRLPNHVTPLNNGSDHLYHCLTLLALFDTPQARPLEHAA